MKPYAPAMQRYETFADETYAPAREAYWAEHKPALLEKTRAELSEELMRSPRPKDNKEDLADQLLTRRWNATELADRYLDLRHYANREEEILAEIEDTPKEIADLLERIAARAIEGNAYLVSKLAPQLAELQVRNYLWQDVARKIGPEELEPIEALRDVMRYATEKVLDAVEDRTEDLNPARVTARWIRRNKHLIEDRSR